MYVPNEEGVPMGVMGVPLVEDLLAWLLITKELLGITRIYLNYFKLGSIQ